MHKMVDVCDLCKISWSDQCQQNDDCDKNNIIYEISHHQLNDKQLTIAAVKHYYDKNDYDRIIELLILYTF